MNFDRYLEKTEQDFLIVRQIVCGCERCVSARKVRAIRNFTSEALEGTLARYHKELNEWLAAQGTEG
jgi:hypothetical protein